MGAWGTSLYSNDTTSDIRGTYRELMKFGKTNEETTNELIEMNRDIIGDMEEEPLFWYALADTQWNYGRLLESVKDKALFFLTQDHEKERWRDSGDKKANEWKRTLEKLSVKLSTGQPKEKKISPFKIYECKWKLGDVFAYKFTGEYSKSKGFINRYIVFRKVSEVSWYPRNIIPIVQVYNWVGDIVPDINDIKDYPLLTIDRSKRKEGKTDRYYLTLISDSERSIPKENLSYMGNIQGGDLVPFRGHDYWIGHLSVGWEKSKYNSTIEKEIIDLMLLDRQAIS